MPFQKKVKPENIEGSQVQGKVLRVFVICGGTYVVNSGAPKTIIDPHGNPQHFPATPLKQVFLRQNTTYTTAEPDVIEALRRSGDIGKDLIELDDKLQPLPKIAPKLMARTLAGLKGKTGRVVTASILMPPSPMQESVKQAPEDDLADFDSRPTDPGQESL